MILLCCVVVSRSPIPRSSSAVRCCGLDRTLSQVSLHSREAVDRTRRDGYRPQQWMVFLAGQVRHERVVLSILFGEPRLVKVPSFVDAKPTFQQGSMGSICRVCPQGMLAGGRRRLRHVMETMCWRAQPSVPRRKVLRDQRF